MSRVRVDCHQVPCGRFFGHLTGACLSDPAPTLRPGMNAGKTLPDNAPKVLKDLLQELLDKGPDRGDIKKKE